MDGRPSADRGGDPAGAGTHARRAFSAPHFEEIDP